MKALILGGVGTMGVHVSAELAASGIFDGLVVADVDEAKARKMALEWGLTQEEVIPLDAEDNAALEQLVCKPYDVIVNALPKTYALTIADLGIEAGARVIDLNSITDEMRSRDVAARRTGATYVAGCGSSSGLTNMMAKHGARAMERVDEIDIQFASFRSVAISPASIHGVFWEFGPESQREYYADGKMQPAALWEGARRTEFPPPYGNQTVYIVPHTEPQTLSRNLGAAQVIVRGTFTPKVMSLMHSLCDYGFFREKPVSIRGQEIARRQLIWEYLAQVPEANQEPNWGYALKVIVSGEKDGQSLKRTLWTTHPTPDCPGWAGSEAWSRCVALPLVAGSLILARGEFQGTGVDTPEAFFPVEPFFMEVEKRGIRIHETVTHGSSSLPTPNRAAGR